MEVLRIRIYLSEETAMKLSLDGLTAGARPAPEVLGTRQSRMIIDASHVETKLDAATGLTIFPIDGVFSDPQAAFLGFGWPNTYLVVPRHPESDKGPGWDKFAAFMFWRQKSLIANTKGRVQSGVLFQLLGLSDEEITSLRVSMGTFTGRRGPSCAHANALVLDSVGFRLGGERSGDRLVKVYRPSKLASLIWQYGLELHGKPVDVRIIHTDARDVSSHFFRVWRREFLSLCRTVKKKFQSTVATTPAPLFDPPVDELPKAVLSEGGPEVSIGISRPSTLGAYLGFLFGPHPIFMCETNAPLDAPELATPLKPFPGKLDRVTKLKKHILFSRPAVWFIRRHLMLDTEFHDGYSARAVVDMLHASDSAEAAEAFKYNLVMTGERIYLTRLKNPIDYNWRIIKWAVAKLNWILAKHVLVSGYDPDVRFSGEVWKTLQPTAPMLHMTGDSGTYQPGDERLDPAAAYVAKVFGTAVESVRTR